jgi:hypothetical protein
MIKKYSKNTFIDHELGNENRVIALGSNILLARNQFNISIQNFTFSTL